jgi:glycosyltransferase involved in cell wall biosynthesis
VRVVSKPIAELAQVEFGVNPEKLFICQVPITFKPDFLDKRMQYPVIGVVGRLHPERGIESVIQILTPLLSSNSKIRLIIVGKGELQSLVHTWSASSLFHDQVEILGEVPQRNLQVVWDKINVLLSAASSEGYGLALREALISGAIVVAKKSDGTIALKEEFKSGIKLFETSEQALEILYNLVNDLETQELNPNVGSLQSEADRIALERLAITWHKSS